MTTERSDVYSISGLFVEGHHPHEIKVFGGFFSVRTDPDEPRQGDSSMPLNGKLVDCYGQSEISGKMGLLRMRFEKRYKHGDLINYEFRRNSEGLWVGEYSFDREIGRGRAVAKTKLDWAGLDMAVPANINPLTFAEDLVGRLVCEGLLKKAEPSPEN